MIFTAHELQQARLGTPAIAPTKRARASNKIVPCAEMLRDIKTMSRLDFENKWNVGKSTATRLRGEARVTARIASKLDGKPKKQRTTVNDTKIIPSPEMLDDIKHLTYAAVIDKYGIGKSTITRIKAEYDLLAKKTKCTRQTVERMIELQEQLFTVAEIAQKVGMHETTAGRAIVKARRHGIEAFPNE